MCGRFVIAKNLVESLPELLGNLADWDPEFINYNIAPTSVIPIVLESAEGLEGNHGGEIIRHISAAQWGLIPSWRKDVSEKPQPFNARIETVASSGMFRAAFRHRRCIVPASAYYEWLTHAGEKTPYVITAFATPQVSAHSGQGITRTGQVGSTVAQSAELGQEQDEEQRGDLGALAFAAIYEDHPEGPRSVAIITRPSTGPAAFIHDRLPVMLTPGGYDQWMGDELGSAPQAIDLLMSESEQVAHQLSFWPVDKRVGNVRNNSQDLVLPCETAQ